MPETELLEVVGGIGPKVRALRTGDGLSLQQLADRSDVSPAAIHKVEQGTMVPTITTLLKLATALDRPVSYFVDEDDARPSPLVYTPAKERPTVDTTRQGLQLGGISGPYGTYRVASAVAVVEPHADSGDTPLNHPGEELVHVLTGVLEVTVGDETVRLTAGDSAHFLTDVDHAWRNPSSRPTRAIWTALRSD